MRIEVFATHLLMYFGRMTSNKKNTLSTKRISQSQEHKGHLSQIHLGRSPTLALVHLRGEILGDWALL